MDRDQTMNSRIVFFNLLDSFICINLYAIERSILVTCYNHPFIPYQSSENTFFRVLVFQDNFVRKRLIGIDVLIIRGSDNQMFLINVEHCTYIESMIRKVTFLYLKRSLLLLIVLIVYLYLSNDMQIPY